LKKFLTLVVVSLALLAVFTWLGRRIPAFQPATPSPTARPVQIQDYAGTWQCQSPSFDLIIEVEGSSLRVSGLGEMPVVFASQAGGSYLEDSPENPRTLQLLGGRLFLKSPGQPDAVLQVRP